MNFRIADTFTDSLAKLSGDEQKAVKMTAFDLQLNPGNPGMKFHRVDGARDKNFWSVRVSRDIRLIVHRTASSLLLCYVDHHDDAYRWAERRKLETHPKTGAAQLVEIRERVREIEIPSYVKPEAKPSPKPFLYKDIPEDELLRYRAQMGTYTRYGCSNNIIRLFRASKNALKTNGLAHRFTLMLLWQVVPSFHQTLIN